jgi:hypothetical protein
MIVDYFPKNKKCAKFRVTSGEAVLLAELLRASGVDFPVSPLQHIPSLATSREAVSFASKVSHASAETLMQVWADNRDLTTMSPADFVVWINAWAVFCIECGGYATYDTQQATWE